MDRAGRDVKVTLGAEEAGDFPVSMPFASEFTDEFTVWLEFGTERLTG
jgi:hypothetical protein